MIDRLDQMDIAAVLFHGERSTVTPGRVSACRMSVIQAGGNIDLDHLPRL